MYGTRSSEADTQINWFWNMHMLVSQDFMIWSEEQQANSDCLH